MGDPSHQLIYSFVARGTTVLAEYTEFSGNFSTIAVECLTKLSAGYNKHTYVCDHHTFNFLVEDGVTFLAVAEEDLGRKVPYAFLGRVKDDFQHRYQGGRADLAVAHSLDHEFGPRLKEHMGYVLAHPDEVRRATRTKSHVAEVKGIMMSDVEDHTEKLPVQLDRTDSRMNLVVDINKSAWLQSSTDASYAHFRGQGQSIRRRFRRIRFCLQFRLKLFVTVLVALFAGVIYLSICKSFICYNPRIPGTSSPPPITPPG